jgi:hypothetical protein
MANGSRIYTKLQWGVVVLALMAGGANAKPTASSPIIPPTQPPSHETHEKLPPGLQAFIDPKGPPCVPVADIKGLVEFTVLNWDQLQFVRGLYTAMPPPSQTWIPATFAAKVMIGKHVFIALGVEDKFCGRFEVPDWLMKEIDQAGEQET